MSIPSRTDIKILHHLSNNARITNKELAERIGVAPSTCFEKTRILQANNVLRGFHADIDIHALGIKIEAMINIRFETHSKAVVDSFYDYAINLAQVTGVFHLSGANDFLVTVAVRSTQELRDFILSAFAERPEVAHIETSIIYQSKRKYGIPRDYTGL